MSSFSSVSQNWPLGGEGAGSLRKFQRREQPIQRKIDTMQQEPWRRPKVGWLERGRTLVKFVACFDYGIYLVGLFS